MLNPKKPDKIRVVFDAAAKNKGQSLNSALCTGPDLQNSLIGVLLRFRKNNIAIVTDAEAMFLQDRVKPLDCGSLQFLWAERTEENSKVETYQILVHSFGATDSPCSANFDVKTVARGKLEKYSAVTIETVLRSFYIDDLLKSVTSEQETVSLIKEMVDLHLD